MARKKTGRYLVVREFGAFTPGEGVDLTDDEAALLIRDGMVTDQGAPEEEGDQ